MNSEIISRLRRPFERAVIKRRAGPGGRTLTYVPVRHYLERLLEAFDGSFSLEVISHDVLEEEVIVSVRLQAGGTVKTAIGGSSITRRRDTGKPVSIAWDLMAAEAVAIKRCCRSFGLALELNDDVDDDDGSDTASPRDPAPPVSISGGGRITSAQVGKIGALVAELDEDLASFKNSVREAHGVTLEHLDKRRASRIIEELIDRARRRSPIGASNARRAQ